MKNWKAELANRMDESDPIGYPYGKGKTRTTQGDGTPFAPPIMDDFLGFFSAVLAEVGASPSTISEKVGDSQILDGIKTIIDNKSVLKSGSKLLTVSGSLTMDPNADVTDPAYYTSNDLRPGWYKVTAYGPGGSGAKGNQIKGGAAGGCSQGILNITATQAYTIGLGGVKSSTTVGNNGGITIFDSVIAEGGEGGRISTDPVNGGTGDLYNGAAPGIANGVNAGSGAGPSGSSGNSTGAVLDAGLASGGGSTNSGTAGDGGNGYAILEPIEVA